MPYLDICICHTISIRYIACNVIFNNDILLTGLWIFLSVGQEMPYWIFRRHTRLIFSYPPIQPSPSHCTSYYWAGNVSIYSLSRFVGFSLRVNEVDWIISMTISFIRPSSFMVKKHLWSWRNTVLRNRLLLPTANENDGTAANNKGLPVKL